MVVGGAPETEIGGTLLEAAIGEDVEVADEAVSEEGKGNIDEDNVVGSDVDEPLWAYFDLIIIIIMNNNFIWFWFTKGEVF